MFQKDDFLKLLLLVTYKKNNKRSKAHMEAVKNERSVKMYLLTLD